MKRKQTVRRQIRGQISTLTYEALEKREVLTGFHQVNVALPIGINLVENGDFSSFSGSSTNYYLESQVPGWQVIPADAPYTSKIKLLPYNGLGRVLDLDSSAKVLDRVFQDIATQAGVKYVLSFDFMANRNILNANPALPAETADIQVHWNNELAAVVRPKSTWATFTAEVSGAGAATSRLMFSEVVSGLTGKGDGVGAFINNVRLVRAVEVSVENGGFENLGTASHVEGDLYLAGRIPQWGSQGNSPQSRLMRLEAPDPPSSVHGTKILNLNSSQFVRDFVFQNADTVANGVYYLQFQARSENAQQLRVRWNGDWAATLRPAEFWTTYSVLVRATNGETKFEFVEGGPTSDNIWIDKVKLYRIDPAGVNQSPNIQQIANQTANFGVVQSYQVNATDPESQSLTYSISHSGIGSGHNVPTISNSGVIQWTPSQAGDVVLTVQVTDSLGGSSTMNFTVTVSPFVPLSGNRTLTAVPPQFRNNIYQNAATTVWSNGRPPMMIDTTKQYEAVFDTTAGEIRVNLFADLSPITVNNFVLLARDGFYDGLDFHRVIDGFMAQGGDPLGTGTGGPGYQFLDETNNGLSFDRTGLLAMANAGAGTNGSQFFMTYAVTSWLNGAHTIFGEVTAGQSAFNAIVRTFTSGNQPISGVVKTKINAVTIFET